MKDNSIPYKEGTIKLTWINPNDYWILESKMFSNPSDAIKYAVDNKKKDWLLFKLVWTDGGKYKWELMPNGAFRSYTTGMKISDNMPLKIIGASLMIVGAVSVFKFLTKKSS